MYIIIYYEIIMVFIDMQSICLKMNLLTYMLIG